MFYLVKKFGFVILELVVGPGEQDFAKKIYKSKAEIDWLYMCTYLQTALSQSFNTDKSLGLAWVDMAVESKTNIIKVFIFCL